MLRTVGAGAPVAIAGVMTYLTRPLGLLLVLGLGCSGGDGSEHTDPTDAGLDASDDPRELVEADLDARLAGDAPVFHFGCTDCAREDDPSFSACPAIGADERFELRCEDPAWRCGDGALEALRQQWSTEQREVTVSWLSPDTGVVGRFLHVYFVTTDGTADHFWQELTDVAGSDCGSYCGWHREPVPGFLGPDGTPEIIPAQRPVSDFSACEWP